MWSECDIVVININLSAGKTILHSVTVLCCHPWIAWTTSSWWSSTQVPNLYYQSPWIVHIALLHKLNKVELWLYCFYFHYYMGLCEWMCVDSLVISYAVCMDTEWYLCVLEILRCCHDILECVSVCALFEGGYYWRAAFILHNMIFLLLQYYGSNE